MCNSVICNGRYYNTPRELADLLGGEDTLVWQSTNPFLKWPEGEDWHVLDLCLCPIDMKATLDRAGLVWEQGRDPMEYFVR
ncbi:hypothetical protein CN090_20040 [Sinorhizobium meliloti]|nr:hypothetical protein CN162_15395 [Sinorhizobium meliloti]RVM69821.1 hypothetical protein CN126_27860 [Sinorhizobium meliloti]RVN54886.1 hypothetical protein CN108_16310 [Sinorhizobium meliloti]RVN62777.1 hypothetical protein CN110_33710 [Sinorhizobium meliloti]RVN63219.1 hypothetical protein CN104_16205 [Sinorhizobium meliloti]